MFKDDLDFLKSLQDEMINQETDWQAAPRFWVLRQYEYEPTGEEWMDKYEYAYDDGDYNGFDNVDDLIEFLEECELATDKQIEEMKEMSLENDLHQEEAFEFILDNLNEEGHFRKIPVVRVANIIPNTLFLTKKAAKEHIKANHYHYNDTIHTYAMTAWRSPEVQRLLEILESIDFSKLELLIDN